MGFGLLHGSDEWGLCFGFVVDVVVCLFIMLCYGNIIFLLRNYIFLVLIQKLSFHLPSRGPPQIY